MRVASIRSMDISNGDGVGVALFVQGCHFHCKNCFNKETWNFNDGKEWTSEIKEQLFRLIDRPYIKRVSILGGEPLAEENLDDMLNLINEIRTVFPEKILWLYTGYEYGDIFCESNIVIDDYTLKVYEDYEKRKHIITNCDVLVDGRYIDELKDLSLYFCGSTNQRVIDVKKSLEQGNVVLYSK